MRKIFATALYTQLLTAAVDGGEGSAPAPAPVSDGTKIRPNTEGYQTAKSASGSSTKICGDAVSLALLGATLDESYGFVAKVTAIAEEELRAKYGDKNLGQQRMFLGNLIRGASQSKDAEKKARIEAAFEQHLPAFREGIDARLAKAQEESQKIKDQKAKERQLKKEEADQKKKDAAAKKADEAAAKKADGAKTAAAAKPAQAKGPGAPAQPE